MKYMVFLSALIVTNICSANEDQLLSKTMDSLATLLSDAYSDEYNRRVHELEKNNLKAVFFTIEGFGGGNNWQRYLAVFQKRTKVMHEPPFTPVGEAKYQLIGYLTVAKDHRNSIDEENFTYKSRKLIIPSISLRPLNRNQKLDDIVIKIKPYSLEKDNGAE